MIFRRGTYMRESVNPEIRIAKFTLDGYFNYGNVLQNYALQQVLLRYADKVDTIWTQPETFLPETWWKWTWKMYIKWLIDRRNFRTEITNGHVGREMARQTKIRDFSDRYISYHRVALAELSNQIKQYDYCFVGSDQCGIHISAIIISSSWALHRRKSAYPMRQVFRPWKFLLKNMIFLCRDSRV